MTKPDGGGFGDPLPRDPIQVAEIVRNGIVLCATAESDYGVVLTEVRHVIDAAIRERWAAA